jgi:uncharacterized protein with HEPN domain
MRSDFGDNARLQHILEAILEIESYTNQASFDDFMANSMMRFASIKQLEIIGEAANYLTDELKGRFSEVEWRQIVGLRNVLIHQYFRVDENVVWGIIQNNVPELRAKVEEILNDLGSPAVQGS